MAIRDFAQTKDGLKLRYEIRGSGEPVALIMGFSGSGRGWGEPFLKLMESRFKIFVIDNRGTGESDKPDAPWTMNDMASDIACVLDHANTPRAHIFGISMGGMIAQEFALTNPARTRGLVLGCTNCGASKGIAAPPEAVAALMPTPGTPPEEQARRAFAVACGKAFLNSAAGQATLDREIAEMGNYPATPMHTFARQAAAIGGFDTFARLTEIKSPTLIIHGDDDAIVPHQNAEILHGAIAGSSVHILKAAGHMFFWEAPEETVRVAGDFLNRVN
ncbi:MAG: alpha/beta hydrolase [Candidatus Binatus sp.]|uniref:alpha/beta fold hydrolase n=1 Tax=Candidatus Binatus sp. TaxID=2811406 RepID=UPI00272918C8|nr:alpha/beta hydrolase [Candidatus Binatus sp.]MDO8434314.1 alpha/beta hydrolase [Candidatus Binatus sp.]